MAPSIIYVYLFGNNSKAQVIFRQNITYRKWTQVPCKCLCQKPTWQKPLHKLAIQPVWQINIPSSFQYLMARMQLYKQSTAQSPAEQRSWKTALVEAGGLPWSRGIPKCRRSRSALHPTAGPMATAYALEIPRWHKSTSEVVTSQWTLEQPGGVLNYTDEPLSDLNFREGKGGGNPLLSTSSASVIYTTEVNGSNSHLVTWT